VAKSKTPTAPKETADEQRLRAIREAEARWTADDHDARARGWGGLVPGTRTLWIGRARMAHARSAAGLDLNDLDLEAITRYPTMPDLIDA